MDRIEQLKKSESEYQILYLAEKKKNFKLAEEVIKLSHEIKILTFKLNEFKAIRSFDDWIEVVRREEKK